MASFETSDTNHLQRFFHFHTQTLFANLLTSRDRAIKEFPSRYLFSIQQANLIFATNSDIQRRCWLIRNQNFWVICEAIAIITR